MKTNQECVLEFTEVFNMFKTEYGKYSRELLLENPKTSKLRYDLIHEEYNELLDAFKDKDFVEVIDALTDILYVTYGAGVALGIDLDKSFPTITMKFRRKEFDETKTHFENIVGSYTLDNKKIKKTIFSSVISDLSGKFARMKLKYFSEFFASSLLKFGYKLEKMTLNDLDILLSIYILYRLF